jgi:hypothetical protein
MGNSMTDEQIWNLVATVGTYLLTFGGAVWWLKGQLTSGEIRALKAENGAWQAKIEAVEARRLLAEDELKKVEKELRATKSQLETAEAQVKANAPKEDIFRTLQAAGVSSNAALSANTQTGTLLGRNFLLFSTEPDPALGRRPIRDSLFQPPKPK